MNLTGHTEIRQVLLRHSIKGKP